MMKNIFLSLLIGMVSVAHASTLTESQKKQILKKCEVQAAKLAHLIDENSKDRADYEDVLHSGIERIDSGYNVHTIHQFHWDIESFDPSEFTVRMSATLGSPCQLDMVSRR